MAICSICLTTGNPPQCNCDDEVKWENLAIAIIGTIIFSMFLMSI